MDGRDNVSLLLFKGFWEVDGTGKLEPYKTMKHVAEKWSSWQSNFENPSLSMFLSSLSF